MFIPISFIILMLVSIWFFVFVSLLPVFLKVFLVIACSIVILVMLCLTMDKAMEKKSGWLFNKYIQWRGWELIQAYDCVEDKWTTCLSKKFNEFYCHDVQWSKRLGTFGGFVAGEPLLMCPDMTVKQTQGTRTYLTYWRPFGSDYEPWTGLTDASEIRQSKIGMKK